MAELSRLSRALEPIQPGGRGSRFGRRAALFGALLVLGGCGFQPLYGPDSPATAMQGKVAVSLIDGAPGFAMRERLTERLGEATVPDYTLDATLKLVRRGVALTQQDYTTRYNLTGTATYRLTPIAGGPPVQSDTITSFTGYSAPQSETASAFASLSAEQDAELRLARTLADQIVLQLAVTAGTRMPGQPAPVAPVPAPAPPAAGTAGPMGLDQLALPAPLP